MKIIEYNLRNGWLIFYTKDMVTQVQYDKLKEIIGDPAKHNSYILPSELIDRVEFIENDRVKLFNLLKKIWYKK